jgi:hypothetical protein
MNTAVRALGIVSAIAAASLTGLAPQARATTPAGTATLGIADFTKNGEHAVASNLASCSVGGPLTGSSAATAQTGVAFGAGTASCSRTVVDQHSAETTTKSQAKGSNAEISALVSLGGPRLSVGSYTTSCLGKKGGTQGSWTLGVLSSGWGSLPESIPQNYVRDVKDNSGTKVLAKATFNEVILASPNDGSLTMNVIHLRFQPDSGIVGDVVIGHAACSRTP